MRRRPFAVAALAALGIVVAATAIEAALRIVGYRIPRLLDPSVRASYRLAPDARFVYQGFLPGTFVDFENPVALNHLGFHERNYASERPTPRTFRLMVLGDSYVAALEVPLEATFHERLESELSAKDPFERGSYQVIAFGQGNRAQQAELSWLRQYGPLYRPDAVLLVFFCGNDVMENSPVTFESAQRFGVHYVREVVPRKQAFFRKALLFPRLRLNGLIAEAATNFYARHLDRLTRLGDEELTSPELGAYEKRLAPEWVEAYARSEALLDEIRAECDRQGSQFLLAGLSGPQAVGDIGLAKVSAASDPRYDFQRPDRWVEDWGRRRAVAYQPLGPELARYGRRRVFWPHDAHLNPTGHAVVAEVLYGFVTREVQALPGPRSP